MFMPSIFNDNFEDRFMDDLFSNPFTVQRTNGFMKTDIKENENSYELTIDVPGVNKEDVKAELKNGYVIVNVSSGKENEEKDKDGKFLKRERFFGSSSRSYYVGDGIKQEDIDAKFENGTLILTIPKKESLAQEEKKYISIR